MHPDFCADIRKLENWYHLLTNGYVLLSIVFFVLSAITWIITLTKIDLSLAYPAVSISFIIVALASYHLFHEAISLQRWFGIGIVIVGVIVMFHK